MGLDKFKPGHNEIDPDNRFPKLGNGRYQLKPRNHIWQSNDDYGDTLVIEVEVVASAPSSGGLQSWEGETFENTPVGTIGAVTIPKFFTIKGMNSAMGKLKSYLGALLAHKGVTAKSPFDFITCIKQFCEHPDDPMVKTKFDGRVIECQVEVKPPVTAGARPWRIVSWIADA